MNLVEVLVELGQNAGKQDRDSVIMALKNAGLEESAIEAVLASPEKLTDYFIGLPEIKCFFIAAAEDDDGEGVDKQDNYEPVQPGRDAVSRFAV